MTTNNYDEGSINKDESENTTQETIHEKRVESEDIHSEQPHNEQLNDEQLNDEQIDHEGLDHEGIDNDEHIPEPSSFDGDTVSADSIEDIYLEYANESVVTAPVEKTLSKAQWLQIYLVAVIFCNLYVLFFEGHFDIGFWKNWVTHLSTNGFANYQGDYPPLWSNWLYVVSQFYNFFHLPIENNILFKHLTQLPIPIYHLLLTYLIYKLVLKFGKNDAHFHAALALTVFNPAILFNGPVWGQIDITPLIPLVAALMAGVSQRHQIWTVPLFTLAMLTKFQMIAFAPIFGILFFRSYKNHLIGILISIPIFLIAFLPNMLASNFVQAFKLPYIGSMHMFSSSTMSASNVWILVTGNLAPDNIILFGIDPKSRFASLFSVRHVGMISFSIICLFVFLAGMRKLAVNKFQQDQEIAASDIFFYALVCTTTFFTLLPGMHERYLLPAAIIALAYFATSPSKAFYPIALTLISALNVVMVHGLRSTSVWPSLSWIMVAVFLYAILEFMFGGKWTKLVKNIIFNITSFQWLAFCVLIISSTSTTYILYDRYTIHPITIKENQILLTTIKPISAVQDYGTLQTNANVAGGPLIIGGKRYGSGFGTHANSTVIFTLPENAKTLSFIAGLDDEVETADVTFFVWGDGKLLWQSSLMTRPEQHTETITIDISGIKQLNLQVSGMGNISGDHADWLNPVITF